MKKNINLILILLMLIFSTVNVFSVSNNSSSSASSGGNFIKVGAAGSEFLKIGVGARANGMAGSYGSVADDLSSIFWNPAGLSEIKGLTADFSYTSWFAGFSHNFAAIALPLGSNFTVAAHIVSFSSSNIEITTMGKPEGTGLFYTVSDIAAGASLSGYLTDQFSFGVTAKYVFNSFGSLSSNGIAFDVGTMYETGIQGIKLGFSIHNLGTQMEYSGQDLNSNKRLIDDLNTQPLDFSWMSSSYSIPLTFRASVSSNILNDGTNKLIGDFDFDTYSDTKEQYSLGAEYSWRDLVAVRAGYRFGNDQMMGIAAGVGLKYEMGGVKGQIDYALNPTYDIGLINRLSICLSLK